MQHLLFIFTDKLMIFFRNFGIFLITYFGIYLVYNLEHFGIFYSAKPGNPVAGSVTVTGLEVSGHGWSRLQKSEPMPSLVQDIIFTLILKVLIRNCKFAIPRIRICKSATAVSYI